MAAIVKFFGWLSVIIGIVNLLVGGTFFSRWAGLLPLGAAALLSGALLIVFARIVELLEEMNEKLSPIFTIAKALESNYRPQVASEVQSMSETDILNNPPPGATVIKYKNRRVVQLSDTTIVAETLTGGAKRFSSLEEFQNFIE
jgi:hypothetical protein